jgi:hypothetical protein
VRHLRSAELRNSTMISLAVCKCMHEMRTIMGLPTIRSRTGRRQILGQALQPNAILCNFLLQVLVVKLVPPGLLLGIIRWDPFQWQRKFGLFLLAFLDQRRVGSWFHQRKSSS